MNRKLLAPYGLKFNPFAQEIPVEALRATARIDSFCARLERQVQEGGFALVSGPPGSGKSSALRILAKRLSSVPDVAVGVLTRPQCGVPDLYRELGDLFGVRLAPSNRWAGAKVLRERWQAHVEHSLFRPALLIDEAQECQTTTLNELRLLASKDLDSCPLLTLVLCGDSRLLDKLKMPELAPIGSRIRARLLLDEIPREELLACLRHALQTAGNAKLMTSELMAALCDHSAGNLRSVMTAADDLLQVGSERDGCTLDERLFLELYSPTAGAKPRPSPGRTR
jgi:general secretion pathway protein A